MPTFQNDPVIIRMHVDSDVFSGGVYGESTKFNGVRGVTFAPGHGAVVGICENHTNQAGPGIFGQSDGTGVWGTSKTWMGVFGFSESTTGGAGVMGEAKGAGVVGKSHTWHGVYGESPSTTGGAGVWGEHKANGTGVVGKSGGGVGVWGVSDGHEGVHAETNSPVTAAIAGYNLNVGSTGAAIYGEHKGNSIGILGKSAGGVGLWGVSQGHEGVHAETNSPVTAAVAAFNLNPAGTGAALFARKEGGAGHAGFFDGRVWISGELAVGGDIVLPNADCAEDFDVGEAIPVDPGTVVVIGADGALRECADAYDGRVAGVISGAGAFAPALVLDRKEKRASRQPVALLGKVFCKVDARLGAIVAGDLLTTSPTRGHAMKVSDRQKALGAVIGKALGALPDGCGLIPMLVALR